MNTSRLDPIQPRRVAVTGMSVASAFGFEVNEFWDALLAGRYGIDRIRNFDLQGMELPVQIAGEVSSETLADAVKQYEVRETDRGTQLGMFAIGRALEDAGFPADGGTPLDLDLVAGSGHGTIHFHHQTHEKFLARGYRGVRPTTVVRIMFNRLSSLASMRFKLTGPNHVVSSACATGAVVFGDAYRRIRFGLSEGVVAAAADSGLELATFAGWNRLGVLSKNPDPRAASRPFDRNRDGLVISEGAAAFVLESWEAAEKRGATILAEVIGYGESSDATHIVQPDPPGQARALGMALQSAGIGSEDLDLISSHGTGTTAADAAEAAALHLALGSAEATRIPLFNTKAQLGHLMGATAAVELVATIRALQTGQIPCCRNLDEPDPACELNFVRGAPLTTDVEIALKNSFAFGGNNCVVVLKKA